MGVTKEAIERAARGALPPGASLLWATLCDTYASIKVDLPTQDASAADRAAGDAHRAIAGAFAHHGVALESLIVEFVDPAGSVWAQRRFGAMKPASAGASSPGATAGPTPGARSAERGAPGSAGHEPIPGLRQAPAREAGALPGVSRIIAVGAGKGGVGKSTIALNLAVGLARRGHAVGLLDGDIYGPSMPTMLGLASHEAVMHDGRLQPMAAHGIRCMTIGKLVDPSQALIWRGPMAHGAFKQLAEQTRWGELDYLVIDLPPGTGDVALTMAQLLRLTGAVIVCTPQRVAQDDAVRAARMFQQLKIDILGVVENMSEFVGDDGKVYDIFGRGGAEVMAQRLGVPFLGAVPITMSLRVNSDQGNPTANFAGADAPGRRLKDSLEAMITNLENQVALAGFRQDGARPSLTIS